MFNISSLFCSLICLIKLSIFFAISITSTTGEIQLSLSSKPNDSNSNKHSNNNDNVNVNDVYDDDNVVNKIPFHLLSSSSIGDDKIHHHQHLHQQKKHQDHRYDRQRQQQQQQLLLLESVHKNQHYKPSDQSDQTSSFPIDFSSDKLRNHVNAQCNIYILS